MAHFVDETGSLRISGLTRETVWSPSSTKATIGVWGSEDRLSVTVTPMTAASVTATLRDGPIQFYRVEAAEPGDVRVQIVSGGTAWDSVLLSFVARRTSNLSEAASTGRVIFCKPSDAQLVTAIAEGRETGIKIAPELERLLLALSDVGKLKVMSLYRRKGGPHGYEQADGSFLCCGVDINGYLGIPVTLTNRAAAIDVVTRLIANFPQGKYDLGFPRPVGGADGFDPASDVFFPVPDRDTAAQCYSGHAGRPLAVMMEPARTSVTAAMKRSGARFPILYPDGLNHLHVKAY